MATLEKTLAVVVFILGLIGLLSIFRTTFLLWNSFLPDFHVFYHSASDIFNHINPYEDKELYTGLGYPLSTLIFYMPFLLFSFATASKLFLLINILCIFLAVYLSIKIVKKDSLRYYILFFSLAVLSFPMKFTLGMGQNNILAYTFLLFSFYMYLRKRDIESGILLGLSLVIKPIFIFMLLYFLLEKSFKTIVIAAGIVSVFIAVSVIVMGMEPYIYYVTSLIPHLFSLEGREVYYNQGLTGFVSRLTDDYTLRRLIPSIISMLLAIFIVYLSLWKRIKKEVLFALTLIVLVLIDTLSWQHHFVFLIFPFVVTWSLIIKRKNRTYPLLILIIPFLLVSVNITNPEHFFQFPYVIFLSHTFYGAVILFVIMYKLALNKR